MVRNFQIFIITMEGKGVGSQRMGQRHSLHVREDNKVNSSSAKERKGHINSMNTYIKLGCVKLISQFMWRKVARGYPLSIGKVNSFRHSVFNLFAVKCVCTHYRILVF